MKTLIKITASIGLTEFILAFIAIVRNKYLAVSIGPGGLGIYSLLNSFFLTVAVFAGTWLANGTTKYISEYYNEGKQKETNQTFTFSTGIVLVLGFLFTAVFILESSQLIQNFLSPKVTKLYFILFASGFIWMNLRVVFFAVLHGMMQVKSVIQARILSSLIDLVLILSLIYFFQLLGFFISLILSSIWASILFFYFIRTRGRLKFQYLSLKDTLAKKLLSFGGFVFVLGLINLGSQYLQRILIAQRMGFDSVGIFHAGVTLMEYIGLLNRGSNFYFFPKMSEAMTDPERVMQINKFLFFIMLSSIPICTGTILFSDFGIRILYSNRFLPLADSLYWFIIATFLSAIGSAFQFALVGSSRLTMHTFSVIVIHSLWVAVPFLLLRTYGISSLGMGFVAGSIAGIMLNFLYLYRFINLRLSMRNILLFVLAIVGFIISKSVNTTPFFWRIIILVTTTVLSFSFLTYEERSAIKETFRKRIRKV